MIRGAVAKGSAWALVTGAGSGIGRCYALRLAALGYNVALVGDCEEPLRKVARQIGALWSEENGTGQVGRSEAGRVGQAGDRQAGDAENPSARRTLVIVQDLAQVGAAQALFDRTEAEGICIDVLINNAGMFSFCDALTTPEQRIEDIILLHDMTPTLLCRLYAAQMIRRGVKGHILNMSSFSQWMPFPGLGLYGASKAFLRTFSVAFAKEVREKGIRVTAICPAGVATDLYGLTPRWQRIGRRLGVLISADCCAKRGLKALWRGRRSVVPDWWNRALIPLCKLLPMCVIKPLRRFTMKFQK